MKGIEFLKKIEHIEEGMISEAASPIKKSRKWNGNMIKFAGLAACIAVFVGAICVSRAGVSVKKSGGAMSDVKIDTTKENLTENLENNLQSSELQEETMPEKNMPISKRMVMLEGKLYVDAGESDIEARCGNMDGSILSSVESGEYPEEDYQSNFGSGYGFQYVDKNSIDINIDEQWIRFETSDSGEQEEPFEEPAEPNKQVIVNSEIPNKTKTSARFEISLSIDTLTSEGAKISIFNLGYQRVTTGTDFCIEKMENGNWVKCNYINGEPAWQEIAQILEPEPETETVFYADWSKIYGSLEKGNYRFIKTFYGNEERKDFFCEFTL